MNELFDPNDVGNEADFEDFSIEDGQNPGAVSDADGVNPHWADEDGAEPRRWKLKKDNPFRLDQFLKNQIGHMSRHQLKKVIDLGGVTVNGKKPKASKKLKKGDEILVLLPPRPARYIKPQAIDLEVLYEDSEMIVINKQAGLTVHPAKAQLDGTLVNGLAYHFMKQQLGDGLTETQAQTIALDRFENREKDGDQEQAKIQRRENFERKSVQNAHHGPNSSKPNISRKHSTTDSPANQQNKQTQTQTQRAKELAFLGETDFSVDGLSSVGVEEARPGIVHRLDKFTTGCIIVAKRDDTHWLLARQFENRTNLKCYLAVVHGNPEQDTIVIDEPITRHHTIREAQAVRRDSAARDALTICRVREQYQGYSLVELELKTGRTHQIRVHMQYIGFPLVGDIVYGGEPVGHKELVAPPAAAGGRPLYSYARDKTAGKHLLEKALAREDMILARPALHATLLQMKHPSTDKVMRFTAPLHQPLCGLIEQLRQHPAADLPVSQEGVHIDLDEAMGGMDGVVTD